jgi:methylmalonyl-CoA/ethylmalonyl-CoA epimerase
MATFRFDHLGVAVPDLEPALSSYREVFGYRLLSGPFDDAIQRTRVCFVGSGEPGDVAIELVAPLGPGSPVERVLSKGTAAYHVCYEVADLEKTLTEVRARGCIIVSKPVPAVAFEGRRIAWFYTPSRQLVEVVEQ